MTRSNRAAIAAAYDGLRRRSRPRVLAAVGLACAAVAGCSSGDDAAPASAPSVETSETAATSTIESTVDSTTSTTTTEPPVEDGPLADVCPERIVIQTAMLPGPDVGPLYALLGPDPQFDPSSATVSAPLVRTDGTVEDVALELRSGGPAVGFLSPLELLAADPDVVLAQTSTAAALDVAADIGSIGVVNLTDRSREVIIVDPATHPGVDSIDAVRDAGIQVLHVTDDPFVAYLEGTGALDAGQLVAGFDGQPAAFVQSGGTIAQQGDELVDPLLIPSLPQWGREVTAIDATAAGWVPYDDSLAVRPNDVTDRADCLGRLVPVIQEAIVAYRADPHDTNALMTVGRAQFTPLARLTVELMDAAVDRGVATGVFGPGADPTVGNFDSERLEPFLAELSTILGVDDVEVDALVTNEFIDPDVT